MGMPFFKAYSEGILRGSLSSSDDTIQLIWIKLLAMANETRDRDGYLRYKKGSPYTNKYIATVCHVTIDELEVALREFKNDIRDGIPRICYAEDRSIFISNFKKYQDKPERKPKEKMPENEKRGMHRRLNNEHPEQAIEDLGQGFGYSTVDKNGEILNKK
jgi:hypothetical protein